MKKNTDTCNCLNSMTYLVMHKKYVSRISALLLLIGFFIFVGGYFFGKQNAQEQHNRKKCAYNVKFAKRKVV